MAVGDRVANFDGVLTQVMLGQKPPQWAAGMSIRSMSGLALRLGILDELGPRRLVLLGLDPGIRMRMADRGASILAAGHAELFRVLDGAAARGNARRPGEAYGELWAWIDRSHHADQESLLQIKRQLAEHASSALRNVKEVDLWGRRILPHGSRNGALPQLHDRRGPAPATSNAGLRTGRLEDLAATMGVQVTQIHRTPDGSAGEILPGAVRGDWATYRYDVGGVIDLIRSAADKPLFAVVPPNMVEVMRARGIRLRWADVYRALREGRLRVAGRLQGRKGVPSLLVSKEEARSACAFDDSDAKATLSHLEGCSRLQIATKTMTALKKAEALSFALRRSPSGKRVLGPTVESLERFERELITAVEIHRLTGISTVRVNAELMLAGIASIVERRPNVQACYVRKEALEFFQSKVLRAEAA
jgi:hypothetical protein